MSSKTKKVAGEAITELKKYLRRDDTGMELLGTVERYLVELRREKAVLKDEVARAKVTEKSQAEKQQKLEAELASLRNQISVEVSRRYQAESAAALDQRKLQELEQRLVPKTPADLDLSAKRWYRMFKELKLRMPHPPRLSAQLDFRGHTGAVFDLDDFFQKWSHDEFITLGLFISVMQVGLLEVVGFTRRSEGRPEWQIGAMEKEKIMAPWVQWMDNSIIGEKQWKRNLFLPKEA